MNERVNDRFSQCIAWISWFVLPLRLSWNELSCNRQIPPDKSDQTIKDLKYRSLVKLIVNVVLPSVGFETDSSNSSLRMAKVNFLAKELSQVSRNVRIESVK